MLHYRFRGKHIALTSYLTSLLFIFVLLFFFNRPQLDDASKEHSLQSSACFRFSCSSYFAFYMAAAVHSSAQVTTVLHSTLSFLSNHVLSYHVMTHLIIHYHTLPCHVMSCHVITYRVILSHLILSYAFLFYLVLSYAFLSYLFLSYFVLSCHILSCLMLFYLI